MKARSEAVKGDLRRRLRRIEGQVQGVQRMLDADRDCQEIVQQLNAVHAAVQTATRRYVRAYAYDCLLHPQKEGDGRSPEAVLDDLFDLMEKVR